MVKLGGLLVAEIPHLRRFARSLVGDRESADDLVQDCLERAWSRAHLLRSEGELRVWLFTILHNLYVSSLRKRRRETRLAAVPGRVEAQSSPARQELGVTMDDLERALDALDDDQRAALLLVVVEDLPYQEAASVLGVPLGTFMSRLHRARRRLRALLEGEISAGIWRIK